MGKFLPSATRLRQLAGVEEPQSAARTLRSARVAPGGDRRSGDRRRAAMEVETSGEKEGSARVPLSEVVSDCVKRWFKDTLKEAKAGDVNMQVLVGQMYYSGYGIPRDAHLGKNLDDQGIKDSFFCVES
ncbi:hypothetical protein BT93_A0536 [Corymbia citriodora subsp. variegata]|nr:hypothetical protein BT93_A0536 [Corymbia citriodora subsp. variegata]